jgi:hypothetical protein
LQRLIEPGSARRDGTPAAASPIRIVTRQRRGIVTRHTTDRSSRAITQLPTDRKTHDNRHHAALRMRAYDSRSRRVERETQTDSDVAAEHAMTP